MKLINIFKQTLKEYELKKPENIYTPEGDPGSLQIKLKRTLVNNFNKEEKEILGYSFSIDDSEGTPLVVVLDKDGKALASIMYDQKSKEYIEGDSSFKYVYTPLSATANIILKDLRYGNIDKLKKDAEEYKIK